jgi:hypothetical protein
MGEKFKTADEVSTQNEKRLSCNGGRPLAVVSTVRPRTELGRPRAVRVSF